MATFTKFTLQSRITVYMLIVTILLIAIFTFIEINNQFAALTRYNILRAKLGSTTAKTDLENAVLGIQDPGQQLKKLDDAITNLKQSNTIEDIDILNENGQVSASTNKYILNILLSANEQHIIKNLFNGSSPSYSVVDRQKNMILQYIPVSFLSYAPDELNPSSVSAKRSTVYVARLSYPLANLNDTLTRIYVPCIFIAVLIIIVNIFLGVILSKDIIGPLQLLNNATKEIAAGNLRLRINLSTGDEIEEVGNTFNDMTSALVRMKERAENANPLTKLPGNNVIHEEIEKRIADRRKFVVVYLDLDNFKSFNDKYGIGLGDQAIKLTAEVLQESLKSGNAEDFLGHEGGDDFVLITTPEKAEPVTNYIINEFDKRIRTLYDKKDLESGYITAASREGEIKQFPIMTISLAGVSNINQDLGSYGQITNICAAIKKSAKKVARSNFILDKTS